MAHSRKSGLDNLVEGAAQFPWWLALLLVSMSYLFLRLLYAHLSSKVQSPVVLSGGKVFSFLGPKLWDSIRSTGAFYGQLLAPMVFLVGSASG